MTNLHKVAVIGLIALAASTSFAAAARLPILVTPKDPHSAPTLDCRVKGTDFWIMNFGSKPIDSGRQVAWRSPTTGDDSVVSLPGTLQPGEELELADVLTDDAVAGSPCAAGFV